MSKRIVDSGEEGGLFRQERNLDWSVALLCIPDLSWCCEGHAGEDPSLLQDSSLLPDSEVDRKGRLNSGCVDSYGSLSLSIHFNSNMLYWHDHSHVVLPKLPQT